MFVKLGEATFINVEDTQAVVNDPNFSTAHNSQILSKFAQFTKSLKKIAPKANDFLYFSAVMMHAAEASALNDDGTLKVLSNGQPVSVGWEKRGESWRWQSNDPSLKPYKNSNRDIFPETELKKAYKKWVGKPLCIDHKSSSVDHVRGFIVDTYYDEKLKRVIALCALDKKNYPDLAHKVSSGYSNNVSMGTAVGKAICSDCGKVASAEPDFCNHMRSKSCYGEINIDLSPIELSIVVNGADPKAKIKHIIAAANSLSQYVSMKEAELKKVASNINFSGSMSMSSDDKDESGQSHANSTVNFSGNNFESFEKDVKDALEKLREEYEAASGEESSEEEYSTKDGNHLASELDGDDNEIALASPGSPRFASAQGSLLDELKTITASIENKLTNLKKDFNKLSTKLSKEEENMSGNMNKAAYYQGAGGANEPTPGKQKYTVDPSNEKLRTDGDKQMFADNMGATDSLFPGDLDRKKLLARAEAEERALRRSAAVALAKEALENRKNAYFQGGGDVNEPTPGKAKYPVDPLAGKLRSQDKQMVGQKPFPEVGEVDGLHPSPESVKERDELKRKEMLRRAGLKAQFVKAAHEDGSLNTGDSRWNLYMGDKLILTASVDEISGNKSDLMFDTIATREFGGKLIQKVKTAGVGPVKALFKSAQAAPAPAAPAAPAAAPAAPAMPMDMPGFEEGAAPEAEGEEADKSKTDPAGYASEKIEVIETALADLKEVLKEITTQKAAIDTLETTTEGEVPGGLAGAPGTEAASAKTAASQFSSELITLANMRKNLNNALITSVKEAIAELKDHKEELVIVANMYEGNSINGSNKNFVNSLVSEAFAEADKSIGDARKLLGAYVKYARGTEAMVKKAEAEVEMRKFAQMMDEDEDEDEDEDDVSYDDNEDGDTDDEIVEKPTKFVSSSNEDEDEGNNMLNGEGETSVEDILEGFDNTSMGSEGFTDDDIDNSLADEDGDSNDADVYVDDPADAAVVADQLGSGHNVRVSKKASFDLSTKSGRAAYRAKLAADMLETSPMLDQAHPKGGFTTQLDIKVEGDHAHVEDLKETHRAMMELATASPKVRKEAAVIHRLVSEGKLDVNDLDSLVAEGLDAETAKYYRDYYGQVEGGKEFANELLKEASAARAEAEQEAYRVKLARSYELAYEMVDRGLCLNDRDAVTAQVEEIMKFNDESFDSLKRVVARHQPLNKKASVNVPQVGLIGSGEIVQQAHSEDLVSQLTAAFSRSQKRMF